METNRCHRNWFDDNAWVSCKSSTVNKSTSNTSSLHHGHLDGNIVRVNSSHSIHRLVNQGSFGKVVAKQNTGVESDIRLENERVTDGGTEAAEDQLVLFAEEAIFLSFGLGCLAIHEESTRLTVDVVWQRFVDADARFVARYVAYHYYRSKGWIVHSGLTFGSDFVLYQASPDECHSTYAVRVVETRSDLYKVATGDESRENTCEAATVPPAHTKTHVSSSSSSSSWLPLVSWCRTSDRVKKVSLLCYVIRPDVLTADQLHTPHCIGKFSVKEVTVQRWDPGNLSMRHR